MAASAAADARQPTASHYSDSLVVAAEPKTLRELDLLWGGGNNVLTPHDPNFSPHQLIATPEQVELLRASGLTISVQGGAQELADKSYDRLQRRAYSRIASFGPFGPWFDTVQELDAINERLDQLAADSEGRAKVVSLGTSWQDRDIKALVVSSNAEDTSRKVILATFTHHAREWLSPMVGMGIAECLVTQYEQDSEVKAIVDNLVVYIVPVLNPDGYTATFNGERFQRTNKSPDCPGGVDLNRNYPTGFGQRVQDCGGETYPGDGAFSEKETQAIKQVVDSVGADRMGWYVDYHSTAAQVMIPYAFSQDTPPNFEKNKEWAEILGEAADLPARPGFDLGQGSGGGALDWFREQVTESLVVELPGTGGFDPPANGIVPNLELQWKGWLAVASIVAKENPAADPGGGAGGAAAGGAAGAGDGGAAGAASGGAGGAAAGGTGGAAAGGTGAVAGAGAAGGTGGTAGSGNDGSNPPAGGASGGTDSPNGAAGMAAPVGSAPAPTIVSGMSGDEAGCSCRVGTQKPGPAPLWLLFGLWFLRRRR